MAEKLSIQIELEGGEEIERQLDGIGAAGQKAFNDITRAAEQAGGFNKINPDVITAKLKQLGIVGPEAFNKIQAAVATAGRYERIVGGIAALENGFHKLEGAIGKTASRLASSLGPLAGIARMLGPVGIGAGLLGAAMIKSAFDAVNSINEINAAAMKMGVTIESLQGLTRGMEQAGLSTKAITSGFAKVQDSIEQLKLDRVKKNLEELQAAAAQGFSGAGSKALRELKEAAEQFTPAGKAAREALLALGFPIPGTTVQDVRELGIELAKLKGLGIDLKVDDTNVEQIEKITDALARMPDTAQRTQIAIQRFGQELGTELIRALQAGGLEIDKFKAKAATMGQPLAQQAIEATKFDQSLNRLSATWRAFNSITLSPALRGTFDFLSNQIKSFESDLIAIGAGLTRFGAAAALMWNQPIVALQYMASGISSLAFAITGISWEAISSGAAAAFAAVVSGIEIAKQAITDFVTTPIANAWQWIVDTFNAVIDAIMAKARAVKDALKSLFSSGGGGSLSGDTRGFARGGHVGGRGTGTSDSNLAWVSRGEHIMPAHVVRQPGVLAFLEALRRGGKIPGFANGGLVEGLAHAVIAPIFNRVIDMLRALVNAIARTMTDHDRAMERVVTSIYDTANALQQMNPGHASGGLLGGRGTGTSDSNLAWVSRGEYITPAHAVRKPGVLAFLEALRRSGGNLRRVLDSMGHFALGGMVPTMPAFAGGGLNSMSNVTIQFPGLPAIGGLRASSDVVEELRKAAAMAQVRSGGRKPSRYS